MITLFLDKRYANEFVGEGQHFLHLIIINQLLVNSFYEEKMTLMGSILVIIGQRMDYIGVGALEGQCHIPGKD